MVPLATSPLLVFVHLLAVCIWVGGFVAIAVVARAASRTLTVAGRIDLFRAVGRSYGAVGGIALVVGISTGLALLAGRSWGTGERLALGLAALLVLATVAGVIQARGMTRLRQRALEDEEARRSVARGARRAAVLRTLIGAITIALLAVGATLAS